MKNLLFTYVPNKKAFLIIGITICVLLFIVINTFIYAASLPPKMMVIPSIENHNSGTMVVAFENTVYDTIRVEFGQASSDNIVIPNIKQVEEEPPPADINESDSKTKYYIKVNYQANVVTIYSLDSSGNYTIPVKAMVCSCGTATPESGVYTMDYKYRWLSLINDVYGQYASRIVGNILFHSVPYLDKSPDTLEYWEFDKLGQTASAGCIRLTVEDAKWIYDNCDSGTKVEFYASDNPGELGKPTVQTISEYDLLRNWDPTDPDENNPWKLYLEVDNTEQSIDSTIFNNDVNEIIDNNV